MKKNRIEKIKENPKVVLIHMIWLLNKVGFFDKWEDETYLRFLYRLHIGKKLNLRNPRTFNEKIQWLKLYDRNPLYTSLVDKYEVKKYIAEKIGEKYVIPTLGVWDTFDDIDFNSLPNKFVLKCTHDSGGLIICRDKSKLDIASAREKIEHCLKRNYYWSGREWPYKNVQPRIIAEKYMEDQATENLPVYKILNFMGKPEIIQSIQDDKTLHETIDYFDTEWNHLNLKQNFPNSDTPLTRPEKLKEMLNLARLLCKDFKFIRTDFYSINNEIYFSEFTFYSDSGLAAFTPESWDEKLGSLIKIPEEIEGGYCITIGDCVIWVHSRSSEVQNVEVSSKELIDYKLMCFNGKVKCSFTCTERFGEEGLKVIFFDREWNMMPFERHYPKSEASIAKPYNYEVMVTLAESLAKDMVFVRVDFYEINGRVYFGELTLYPGTGMEEFTPDSWDLELGNWLELPQ